MLDTPLSMCRSTRDSLLNLINPFVPDAPFPYPLKTSEDGKVFCFQGVEKECIVNKFVKM